MFGNAGDGKSTLARRLSDVTRLPLLTVDMIKFKADGEPVPDDEYLKIHPDLIHRDKWIIDGFGCVPSAWERFPAADTLIYADLPLLIHYRWVTKRFIKGLFASPEGWSVCTAPSARTEHPRVALRVHLSVTAARPPRPRPRDMRASAPFARAC